MLKILEVALGAGIESGGPGRSIAGLTKALSATAGCEVSIFVHNATRVSEVDYGKAKVLRGTWFGEHWYLGHEFGHVLDEVKPDMVHMHGLWHPILHFNCQACRKRHIPYVISPRGSLDAWSLSQKRLKKRLALALYQMRDINLSAALHVTADMEANHCRNIGYKGRFIISPNGVNLPSRLPEWNQHADGRHRMLFLSRIHPKKGLIDLVRAWAEIRPGNWVLEIVGNDSEGYWSIVKDEIQRCGIVDSVIYTSFLDDSEKWRAYRRADCFVLPTYTENFGIVIAESLFAGVPVVTTKNAPWESLVSSESGWWIDLNHKNLVSALRTAMSMSDGERKVMGENGRRLVIERYDWRAIAEQMVSGFINLLGA